jgi:hypothetical protein
MTWVLLPNELRAPRRERACYDALDPESSREERRRQRERDWETDDREVATRRK